MKKFQAGAARKFSIKVWLGEVNRICMSSVRAFTPDRPAPASDFNQGSLKIFQSKSARKILIRVRLKFGNQTLIDPELFFDQGRDRD